MDFHKGQRVNLAGSIIGFRGTMSGTVIQFFPKVNSVKLTLDSGLTVEVSGEHILPIPVDPNE